MAARRALTSATRALSTSAQRFPSTCVVQSFRPAQRISVFDAYRPSSAHVQQRWNSGASPKPKNYDFDAIRSLADAPDPGRLIIDVREPGEYQDGYIPGAINIPVKSAPDALFMPGHEFEDKFGFSKPKADQELVFYCRAGVRSRAAAQLAQQVGYKNVSEYPGSWLDWEKNGGKIEK